MRTRRVFLQTALAAGLRAAPTTNQPYFQTSNSRWQSAYDHALTVLAANTQVLPRYPRPVLIEGAAYSGIWMECGPHEALIYRHFRPDVARNSHFIFFALQRPDGQLPANNKLSETGFGQIQMVVPIAATAWELARATGDDELLATAYRVCSAWDAWLLRCRNTRGTGLTEGFCTYDTGHDNSPRWAGIPPQCPGKDAKRCPPIATLPRLCPDLSATTYGARTALASMAKALGRNSDADRWTESAANIRRLIRSRLYSEEDAAFYDLDAEGRFVRIRSDILSRVCGEHVPDQVLFDALWSRQIHNPKAFWSPYPLPSIALDDPHFVRPIPRNSWGGASQALTALRAGRWLEHYGHPAESATMMNRWCEALQADATFRQQLDPLTGDFTKEGEPAYSPAALVMVDCTWRLAGVREEDETIEWNVRPEHPAAGIFRAGATELKYAGRGADLRLRGRLIAQVESGATRIVTDQMGAIKELVGITESPQQVLLRLPGRAPQKFSLRPNERRSLTAADR